MVTGEYLLLVEDDVALGENIEELLADAGHSVVRCDSAEQALERADLDRCRGVITDVRLPGLSGIDLLERLRQRSLARPAVVVSALMNPPVQLAAQTSGASLVLTKPVDLTRLLAWAREPS